MTASTERTEGLARREADRATRRLSRTYQDALAVADAGGAGRVARQALGEGLGVAGLYQRVIAPAMWRIGELWEQGEISVADEHLATALTHQAMASIYGPSLGHKVMPGRILMAAVEGEQHALGLRMAADVIELAGYETIYLGADVPTADLLQAVATRSPDLIGLSATMPSSIPALDRAIAEIQRLDPNPIVLFGGQGARPRAGSDGAVLVRDLEQLLGVVEVALDIPISDSEDSPAPRAPPLERIIEVGAPRPADPAVSSESAEEDESVERHLSGIAAETADLARDLARQANTYKDLAYTDTLSGLPNRRAFEDHAARLRDFSDAKPLAVLMMDLDGFKPVNDSEGHEAGDRILVLMARTITGGLREGDFVARFGGDEFAALLPRTDLGEAEALAERLRVRVQEAGSDASVTSSIGVAMLEDDVRRALLRADGALYEAKNSGRNAVRCG
ncbi:MAG TPA: diguanylate cyclase [Solirubrobacterales bacterium]|nr:diguanylate cyclase [Solirubrobacterales bacterium]